jgi:hypothetical protein
MGLRLARPPYDELCDLFAAGRVMPVGQGLPQAHCSARDALGLYRIRKWTTERAGIQVDGIAELLSTLSTLEPERNVLVFHFDSGRRLFSVFLDEQAGELVGCIGISRRQDR